MLERYRLNELDAADRARVDAALAADPSVRERLDALEADDRAILAAHPPARVAASVRAQPRQPARRSWLVPALALATVAVIAVVTPRGEDDIRLKGETALRLFRLAGDTPERLDDGAKVKPHDVVQVAFELQGAKHLAVVSVDGAGQATRHWPSTDDTTAPDAFKRLPQSFELDEAPGFERFFLVTSDAALDVNALLAAAKSAGRTGALTIPPGAQVRSLLLDKVSP
jgi:hypothetical protein